MPGLIPRANGLAAQVADTQAWQAQQAFEQYVSLSGAYASPDCFEAHRCAPCVARPGAVNR